MVAKKRPGIKPIPAKTLPKEADDFVKGGGLDPEIQRSAAPTPVPSPMVDEEDEAIAEVIEVPEPPAEVLIPQTVKEPTPSTEAIAPVAGSPLLAPPPRKRGRPATGKRSDDEWIGRTFYVKRETDLDVEELLLRLKRRGVDIDKSELVEKLLFAWVNWHKGENLEIQLDEISPR